MVSQHNVDDERRFAETLQRAGKRLNVREAAVELVFGAGFFAAVAGVWALHPPGHVAIVPALLCTALLAFASRVRFDTPLGFTVPTQLAFVPLLFALPLALVPLAVLVGMVAANLIEVREGRMGATRLWNTPSNCWFSIGPVALLAAVGTEPRQASLWILVAALGAQFAIDFCVSSFRFGIAQGVGLNELLRDSWIYAVDAALSGVALCVAQSMAASPAYILVFGPLLALFAVFASERRRRVEGMLELSSAYRGTALVLGDVVEADDGYTGEHSKSVVGLALEVGDKLGLNAAQRRNLEFGALLHDVGKITIPKAIINKPGKLNAEEWTTIKTHTLEGQKMLERVGGFMRDVGLIVRSHHERWDGGGYPDGLTGEQIPLESRIISCCDTWNAMRTDRSYRKALSREIAVTEMLAISGTQLDPRIAGVLLEIVCDGVAVPLPAEPRPTSPLRATAAQLG